MLAAWSQEVDGIVSQANPSEPTQRRFRPDIEGLRAVAVVAVVLAHANLGVAGGYVGVDVFFVISGFLITRQLLQESDRAGRFSFARFYARRARRIVPAATLVTIATLYASYLWAPPLRIAAIARDGLAAALFGVNWRLAAQGTDYFQSSAPPSPFQHYWSLSVEEQFYLGWPLLLAVVLFAVRNRDRRARIRALVGVLCLVIVASLWASVHVTHASAPYGYFGTDTRVWELAAGALVATTADALTRIPRAVAAGTAWAGLAAIVAACFVFDASTAYPGYAAALPVGGAALIIVAGCGAAPRRGPEGVLRLWPVRWTGRISYSLYLWHWPLLILLPDAAGHPFSVTQRLATIVVAFALATLTYFLVEQPFQRRRVLVAKPRLGLSLGVGLVALSVVVAALTPSLVSVPGGGGSSAQAATPLSSDAASALGSSSGAGAALGESSAAEADLKHGLAAAATTKQLPASVQPPLAQAATNYPNSLGCEVDDSATVPKLQCDAFGAPTGATQVVLIGDSHAGMWLGAMSALALANHWQLAFFAKSGCPLGDYPDYVNPSLKRAYTECNAWRTAVIAHVVAMHPALIVVGSQGRTIAGSEQSGFQKSIKALKAGGSQLVFLGDTPSPATIGSVPDCLSEHTSDVGRCAIPRSDAALKSAGRLAEIAGAKRAGATVVDPTSWFCTATECPAVVANTIVYEDNSHITATYARLLAPELGRILKAALAIS